MWGTKANAAGNTGTPANAVRQLRGVAAALVALFGTAMHRRSSASCRPSTSSISVILLLVSNRPHEREYPAEHGPAENQIEQENRASADVTATDRDDRR